MISPCVRLPRDGVDVVDGTEGLVDCVEIGSKIVVGSASERTINESAYQTRSRDSFLGGQLVEPLSLSVVKVDVGSTHTSDYTSPIAVLEFY